jgi:dihydropteroate synthase-like protein
MGQHYYFVTGRLAEPNLRRVVEPLARAGQWAYTIDVLPITVAALMTPAWIARHIGDTASATQIVLPGYCNGDLQPVEQRTHRPVKVGPKDLQALPEFFGQQRPADDFGAYRIEILAEINHAPRLKLQQIRQQARQLADEGADVIDLGCEPGHVWSAVAECVRALRDDGHRVSIDSFDVVEIAAAARAGAELVLSVNHTNRDAAADWGCAVVAIPDDPTTLDGLQTTLETLDRNAVPYRVDPILEPIGFGFAASLKRYLQFRESHPETAMLMGIGNLTELTDADSAAINILLLGFCEELRIGSVLTTQVIPWCQTSVRECDRARRLVHYAVRHHCLPKHLDSQLVLLRDARLYAYGEEGLRQLAEQIRDTNFRIFAEDGQLHLIGAGWHVCDRDPFKLFEHLLQLRPRNLDTTHAFYLGYELSKALTALTLGKQYRQDEALDWGFLTQPEVSHRARRHGP